MREDNAGSSRRSFLKQAGAGMAIMAAFGDGAQAAAGGATQLSMGGVEPLPEPGCIPDSVAADQLADLGIRRMSELDRLPWFTKDDAGRICLREDAEVPPIIDMHSHLGWAQGFGRSVDMTRRCNVEYFYDYERGDDFLSEQNHPTKDESGQITREILELIFRTPDRNVTHSAANLGAEMDRMRYASIALLPIEIPHISRHARDTLKASALDSRFIPFGAVHPFPWGKRKQRELQKQIDQYAVPGIKFHPEFQFIAPDDNDSMGLFEWCADKGLLVYSHVGYTGSELKLMRDKAEPARFVKPLQAFPNLRMVFAHTGVRLIDETLEVARAFEDQVWLDISGQPAPNIAYILQRYDTQRIFYASDWPFMPLAVMMARTLVATEGCPDVRQRLFHDNAASLLGLA